MPTALNVLLFLCRVFKTFNTYKVLIKSELFFAIIERYCLLNSYMAAPMAMSVVDKDARTTCGNGKRVDL